MCAFLEAYHVYKTHPQGLRATGDANAQYDVFGEHVSRFMHTSGTQSPHVAAEQTEQEILDFLLGRRFAGLEGRPIVPEGKTARDVYYKISNEQLANKYGSDYSEFKVADSIDSIEYFVFPNGFFFPGARICINYRFLPNPDNPDECTFDLLFLRLPAVGQPAPAPAKPYFLDINDSYTTAPGMDPGLGGVFDQNFW